MEREIKFRAWDVVNNCMGNVKEISFFENVIVYGISKGVRGDDNWTWQPMNNKDIVLMQFTGFYDKNLREVFEGDIIKHETGEICKVEFIGGAYNYIYLGPGMGQMKKYMQQITANWITVIGNIYENPYLLK